MLGTIFEAILSSTIGAFFSSLWKSWFEKQAITKAADEKEEADATSAALRQETDAIRIRNEVENLPSSGPDSAVAQLHREYSRPD